MRRWLCSAHPESISEVRPAPPPAALSPALLPALLAPPAGGKRARGVRAGLPTGPPAACHHSPPQTWATRTRAGRKRAARSADEPGLGQTLTLGPSDS